ncbi:RNA polymerase recycling motor HelD [Gorillibacterium massiliense]|uniref:RNA polymerase recycling motor HelD n=1 Tax=Gorillibacterium massiliense TaxID=1280390 RepID=UPI0004AE9E45|nr:RNA polymerase recycling motor HelD [Gorillibacterium massiliense]
MAIEDTEWDLEKERLSKVVDFIGGQMGELRTIVEDRKGTVIRERQHFWDDITVNVENEDEQIETAASITQQRHIIAQQERSYRMARRDLDRLFRLQGTPWFGRIDFREEGEEGEESIYVGIGSLANEKTGEIYVYDWRAPIAGMFYDYSLGPAQYETPIGTIAGNLELKRQYVIRGGKLLQMFDTGMPIGDELLRELLGQKADDKMKSIVTTIQREQNEIIRSVRHGVLIVQGSAGSGKTSVALQRVAYLLYKYREYMDSDNILLFSPNPLFNDYVSTVLPDLGEANMRQATFHEYMDQALGSDFSVEHPYDRLEELLTAEDGPERDARVAAMTYKASAAFVKVIKNYRELLKKSGLVFRDFTVKEKVLISGADIAARFYGMELSWSIENRLEILNEQLLEQLTQREEHFAKSTFRRMQNHPKYLGTDEELRALSRKRAKAVFAPLKAMAKRLDYVDIRAVYRELFADPERYHAAAEGTDIPPQWQEIRQLSMKQLGPESSDVPNEDAAPLLYLKAAATGLRRFLDMRHVLVDEVQDYSAFQMEFIKDLFPRAGLTLLGDLNQGINGGAGLSSYSGVEELFGADKVKTFRLFKSYRSTRQIVDFSKGVLPEGEPVEAFSREGEEPRLTVVSDGRMAEAMAADITALQTDGMKSIAVIARTAAVAAEVFGRLVGSFPEDTVRLITKETRTFTPGITVLPSYLAKGLEFDAVLVPDAGPESYHREEDRKLLYTVCTRAMHLLLLYSSGRWSRFIQKSTQKAER